MKAFGIEIRKTGMANLYADVDVVLKKTGINSGEVTAELQSMTAAVSLQKMFKDRYFNICTIDYCEKMCAIRIPVKRREIYQSLHCVYWNTMEPPYRELIIAMVLDDFRTVLNQ